MVGVFKCLVFGFKAKSSDFQRFGPYLEGSSCSTPLPVLSIPASYGPLHFIPRHGVELASQSSAGSARLAERGVFFFADANTGVIRRAKYLAGLFLRI